MLILKEKLAAETTSTDEPLKSHPSKPNHWRNFRHGKTLYQCNNLTKF
jgi:hypothetical protein